jgi:hypothetical protein
LESISDFSESPLWNLKKKFADMARKINDKADAKDAIYKGPAHDPE